jgi:hypothetical protein
MSYSYSFEIYRVNSGQLPASFTNLDSLEDFRANHGARLTFEAKGGDVFLTLEECVRHLGLSGLDTFALNKYDQKFNGSELGELWLRQPLAGELEGVCRDVSRIFEIAKSNPKLLVFDEWQYPDLQAEFEKEIAESASIRADVSRTDLTWYDEGEFWDHFFSVVETAQAIFDEAKMGNQSILFVWYCA